MATQSYLVNSVYVTGCRSSILKPSNFGVPESSKYPTKRNSNCSTARVLQCCSCYTEILNAATTQNSLDSDLALNTLKLSIPETSYPCTNFLMGLLLGDLDPATAKLAIGFLGPFLSAFGFLFILRIVMSWYPKLPVGKFPYVIAYAPTEPLLNPTRKVIPPLAGVDVTPVVWFGLISFLNEILQTQITAPKASVAKHPTPCVRISCSNLSLRLLLQQITVHIWQQLATC